MAKTASLLIATLLACVQAAAQDTLIIVTSPMCGPCRQFKADAKSAGLLDGVEATWLEVPRDRREVRRLNVSSVPTFILMDGDTEVARHIGYTGPQGFLAWLKNR